MNQENSPNESQRLNPASQSHSHESPEVTDFLSFAKSVTDKHPGGLDPLAELIAQAVCNTPSQWDEIIEASRHNQLAFKTVKALLSQLRNNSDSNDRETLNNVPDELLTWILDYVTDRIKDPGCRGRSSMENVLRNVLIVQAVKLIHDREGLPYEYESEGRLSACKKVAKAFYLSPATVRSIWRKNRADYI